MRHRRLPHLHGLMSCVRDEPLGWLNRSHEVLASAEGSYFGNRASLWKQMSSHAYSRTGYFAPYPSETPAGGYRDLLQSCLQRLLVD